jgi:hypothetical protein
LSVQQGYAIPWNVIDQAAVNGVYDSEALSCLLVEAPSCLLMEAPNCLLVEAPSCLLVEAPNCLLVEAPSYLLVEAPSCLLVEPLSCLLVFSQVNTIVACLNLVNRLVPWVGSIPNR